MEGKIVNYRRGRRTMRGNQMIIEVDGYTTRGKAAQLVGKQVVWTSPAKKEIHGKIVGVHGNSGAVRVRFSRGMPGQAIGAKVAIAEKKAPAKRAAAKKESKPKAAAKKPAAKKEAVPKAEKK